MQVAGRARVVAEPRPRVSARRRAARPRARAPPASGARRKRAEIGVLTAPHRRLLQHDLGEPHPVGIGRLTRPRHAQGSVRRCRSYQASKGVRRCRDRLFSGARELLPSWSHDVNRACADGQASPIPAAPALGPPCARRSTRAFCQAGLRLDRTCHPLARNRRRRARGSFPAPKRSNGRGRSVTTLAGAGYPRAAGRRPDRGGNPASGGG